MIKRFLATSLMCILLGVWIGPVHATHHYEDMTEGQLNQALAEAERNIAQCEQNIGVLERNLREISFKNQEYPGDAPYREKLMGNLRVQKAQQNECVINERKKLTLIKQELGKRMKDVVNKDERDRLIQIRQRADKAMADTHKQRGRLSKVQKQLDELNNAVRSQQTK